MNFFHHKDLGNHLLQLCPKVVKHPVYNKTSIKRNILTIKQNTSESRSGQGLISTPVDVIISQIYFGMKLYMFRTVPVSIIRSLFTIDPAILYVTQVCRQLSSRSICSCSKAVYTPV